MAEPRKLPLQRSPGDVENEISQILSRMDTHTKRIVLQVPGKYRLQYARSLADETKKALAIKMKCYECVGFQEVADQIGECRVRACPLWLHRPFQNSQTDEEG